MTKRPTIHNDKIDMHVYIEPALKLKLDTFKAEYFLKNNKTIPLNKILNLFIETSFDSFRDSLLKEGGIEDGGC